MTIITRFFIIITSKLLHQNHFDLMIARIKPVNHEPGADPRRATRHGRPPLPHVEVTPFRRGVTQK